MDINLMIAKTINSLSQPQVMNGFHAGEIAIAEEEQVSRTSGGKEASREDIERLTQALNKAGRSVDQRVSFEYNEKIKRIVMRVADPNTHEVVRQIPSREMMRILENIHDMIGIFVDEQR